MCVYGGGGRGVCGVREGVCLWGGVGEGVCLWGEGRGVSVGWRKGCVCGVGEGVCLWGGGRGVSVVVREGAC